LTDYDDVEILLVEDNRQDAEMTTRALKKCKIVNKVYWAKDGVEALNFIRCTEEFENRNKNCTPKVILLDLKMPRLDGLDVIRALKAEESTRKIPIVVMTSSNQERDVTESYRLGVNGYVTKPVQSTAFVEAVANIGMFWLFVNSTPV
jgi:CheY-like chemotaxis protein